MIGDQIRRATARNLLRVRDARRQDFSSELFDEYAWDMLLHLFVASTENKIMTERAMVKFSGAPLSVGRRWLNHLLADGQIANRSDGEDIVFQLVAADRMRSFLDKVAVIQCEDDST